MSEFDPYYLWLGIPLDEQPPHYYRLLAITIYEQDAVVIEAAADRQMAYVKTHAAGPHSELSQQLLNEISVARVCLLIPEQKTEYDRQLEAQLAAEQAASQPAEPAPRLPRQTHSAQPPPQSPAPAPYEVMPLVQPQQAQRQQALSGFVAPAASHLKHRRKKPLWQQPAMIAAVFGGLLALVLIIYLIGRNQQIDVVDKPDSTDRKTQFDTPSKTLKTTSKKNASSAPTEKKKDAPPLGKESGVIVELNKTIEMVALDQGEKTPVYLRGARISRSKPRRRGDTLQKYGVLEFSVTRGGVVYLITNTGYQGNRFGGWYEERVSKADLVRLGWTEVGPCPWKTSETILRKTIKKGEKYRIRTNKYSPPGLVIPAAENSSSPATKVERLGPSRHERERHRVAPRLV